jgi:hypothetical protein
MIFHLIKYIYYFKRFSVVFISAKFVYLKKVKLSP